MAGRTFILGATIIAVLVAWSATSAWTRALALPAVAPPAPSVPQALAQPAPPAAGRRPGRPVMGGPGWRVLSHVSVLDVLIVKVETSRLHEAPGIAHHIIAPATSDHVEALVYFHRPRERMADLRVQWTPAGGYATLRLRGQSH